jgi:hypothetical protein
VQALEPCRRFAAGLGGPHPFQHAEVLEDRGRRLARIQAALLRKVADPIAIGRIERLAEHLQPAAVRLDDVEDRSDERGLARAVGTEQPEDLARAHLQRDVVEGDGPAEALRHPFRANRRRR